MVRNIKNLHEIISFLTPNSGANTDDASFFVVILFIWLVLSMLLIQFEQTNQTWYLMLDKTQ